jgi:hypothetical protein
MSAKIIDSLRHLTGIALANCRARRVRERKKYDMTPSLPLRARLSGCNTSIIAFVIHIGGSASSMFGGA